MHDRPRRLLWTLFAIALPGPWTPVIVLVYVLGRIAERNRDVAHDLAVPYPPPYPHLYPPPDPDIWHQVPARRAYSREAASLTANWRA